MADTAILPASTSPTTKAGWKYGLRIFVWIFIFAVIAFVLYWVFFVKSVSQAKIKELIQTAAKTYGNPGAVEILLATGVKEILSNPYEFKELKAFASSSGVPIEQVLVDTAVKKAKNNGFLE